MENLLPKILSAVAKVASVTTEDHDDTGEWIRVESEDLSDDQLYALLFKNWLKICGPWRSYFALIHCREEPDAGVWIHYLSTAEKRSEYARGWHQVPSWS